MHSRRGNWQLPDGVSMHIISCNRTGGTRESKPNNKRASSVLCVCVCRANSLDICVSGGCCAVIFVRVFFQLWLRRRTRNDESIKTKKNVSIKGAEKLPSSAFCIYKFR